MKTKTFPIESPTTKRFEHSQQQSMIDSLRTRAGLLLSAAAITTSFLGAQALNDGGPSVATWLALSSFVSLSIAVLAILWPHRLEFTANPTAST